MTRNWVQLGTILLFLTAVQTEAATFYVKAGNGSASPPYSTWNTAAATIQDAVDSSTNGDLIWVTNGTYSTGGRIVYGNAMNRVAIDRAVTVQSVNGAALTIIQGVPGPSNSAVRCVYLASGANLIGFTVKSGSSRGDGDYFQEQCGGGVLCQSISAVVSNCILSANNAYGEGGGTYSGTFNNCTFSGNKAPEGGGASTANLNNCVLSGNSATYGAGAQYGALNNCILTGNNAHDPTGKAVGEGGGVDSSSATNCIFTNNVARVSGGASSFANLVNCLVAGNSAPQGGGASAGTLVNCTVVGNTSTTSGSISGLDGGIEGSTAVNCIILFNTASFGNNNYDYNYGFGGATLSNCCTSPQPNNQGPGNFVADALFVNYAGSDYHLQSNSPCINAGLNAGISATNDLDGNPRITGGTVDIGTYEFQSPASILSYAWAQQYGFPTDGSADYADLDGDGMKNWQEWKAGTDPTSAASVLKVSSLSNSISGTTVTWQSIGGVTYNLQRSSTLSLPPAFSLIQNNLTGQSGTTSYTDTNATGFSKAISLKDQHPSQQMQQIKNLDFAKSLNAIDQAEPAIFGLVRLRVAEIHFGLISKKMTEAECEAEANKMPFIVDINKRLKVVNLECKIRLIDLRTWQYSFEFFDMRRNKTLPDINSLSAGQKAIIHLVFEAYGRGNLKGGLVVIDEPEIHLHYQFQNEYLQVIRELNKEQSCQYILVTHSEALINSSTISRVRRFSLSRDGDTEIKAPVLSTDQRILIKILDNTRATYAFFAKKVLLVEGDTDRYLVKAIIQDKYPEFDQQIAILDIGGKGNYAEWGKLFESFGLVVYCLADFDLVIEKFYPNEKGLALKTAAAVAAFKLKYPDWEAKINAEYAKRTFILKNGDLEHYLGITKGLNQTIVFCNTQLPAYLANDANAESLEIREIIKQVCA